MPAHKLLVFFFFSCYQWTKRWWLGVRDIQKIQKKCLIWRHWIVWCNSFISICQSCVTSSTSVANVALKCIQKWASVSKVCFCKALVFHWRDGKLLNLFCMWLSQKHTCIDTFPTQAWRFLPGFTHSKNNLMIWKWRLAFWHPKSTAIFLSASDLSLAF